MRVVTPRSLLVPVAVGSARNLAGGPRGERTRLRRELWLAAKRFAGSQAIREVELSQLGGVADTVVHGYADDVNRLLIAALCANLECRTFFEIGTYLGRTAYTVALTNPETTIYTLDLPSREAADTVELELTDPQLFVEWERGRDFVGTPEAERIHQLFGDSASFDFSPYHGRVDVAYVDGSHSYTYVKSDSENALELIHETGTILWDDYPHYPGVYAYLNELSSSLERPLVHIAGTRLVAYSRHPLFAA
jgi:methyltransferase family protein